jgi:hypothetical protein
VGQLRHEYKVVGQLPFGELAGEKAAQLLGSDPGIVFDNDYG